MQTTEDLRDLISNSNKKMKFCTFSLNQKRVTYEENLKNL